MFDDEVWRQETDVAALYWLCQRLDRFTAFGVCNLVLCEGLPKPWMRDARDAAAVLALAGVGKHHNRRLAEDLLAEPDIPPVVRAALTMHLMYYTGKADGRGRPPKPPLAYMRDRGVQMYSHQQTSAFHRAAEDVAREIGPEVGLGPSHIRKLREAALSEAAPRYRGRRPKKAPRKMKINH